MIFRSALSLMATTILIGAARAEIPFQVTESNVTATVLGLSGVDQPGRFRSQTQVIFSPASQQPERRHYEVFDPAPQLERAFTWAADDLKADRPGRITGSGRLIWRAKDSPAYDDSAILAAYRGSMKAGRPEGIGLYAARDGLIYDGQWRDGVPHGQGRLLLPNGAEYEGAFRHGLAEGRGTFTEPTWERFEGTFARGQRHGTGKTTLASGLTYESDWRAGTETPNSYRIRVAQIGAAPPIGGTEDVKLGLTMDRTLKFPTGMKAEHFLTYAARKVSDKLVVEPADRKMVSAWVGNGVVQARWQDGEGVRIGNFGILDGFAVEPAFRMELQNKAQQPVEVQALELRIASSMTENQPAIDLVSPLDGCKYGYDPTLTFQNYGWTKARNARMRIAFAANEKGAPPASLPHTISLGEIDASKPVNFERALSEAGAKVAELKRINKTGFPCAGDNRNACLEALKTNPVFGSIGPLLGLSEANLTVWFRGRLEYDWTDAKGVERKTSSPLLHQFAIGNLPVQAECGAGGPDESVRQQPIALKLDQESYTIPVPFRRTVSSGRSVAFSFSVKAEKSSRHDFELVAKLADGRELKSPPIKLLYYKPRPIKTN